MPFDLATLQGLIPGRPLKLYLTRRASGLYMFTAKPPVTVATCYSQLLEVWPTPGDEFFTQICAGSAERMQGRAAAPLAPQRGRLVWIPD